MEEPRSCLMASVGEHTFAIPLEWIRNIVQTPDIVPLPNAPPHIRGTVLMIDGWTSLVDMRRVCGLRTVQDERDELVGQLRIRQQEHQSWLDRLAESAESEAPFDGEVDPTKCAFGRWYAGFVPPNPRMVMLFEQFGDAHVAVHEVAIEVAKLQRQGKHEEARRRVALARTRELARLLILFDRTYAMIEDVNREVTISLQAGGVSVSIAVDTVHRVENVTMVDRVGRNQIVKYSDGKHAILLEADLVLARAC